MIRFPDPPGARVNELDLLGNGDTGRSSGTFRGDVQRPFRVLVKKGAYMKHVRAADEGVFADDQKVLFKTADADDVSLEVFLH